MSVYRLGRMSGCDPSLISRFLSGSRRDLSSETMDRVAAALGLALAPAAGPVGPPEGEGGTAGETVPVPGSPAVADLPAPALVGMEAGCAM